MMKLGTNAAALREKAGDVLGSLSPTRRASKAKDAAWADQAQDPFGAKAEAPPSPTRKASRLCFGRKNSAAQADAAGWDNNRSSLCYVADGQDGNAQKTGTGRALVMETFEVTLEKTQQNAQGDLGIRICEKTRVSDHCIMITGWADGPLKEWNNTHPDSQVMPNDVILQVNGVSGQREAMLAEVSNSNKVALLVGRPERLRMTVKKPGNSMWGVGVANLNLGGSAPYLLVTEVRLDSAVECWWQESLVTISPGDVILEVNSITEDAEEMKQACHESGVLCIVVAPSMASRMEMPYFPHVASLHWGSL